MELEEIHVDIVEIQVDLVLVRVDRATSKSPPYPKFKARSTKSVKSCVSQKCASSWIESILGIFFLFIVFSILCNVVFLYPS